MTNSCSEFVRYISSATTAGFGVGAVFLATQIKDSVFKAEAISSAIMLLSTGLIGTFIKGVYPNSRGSILGECLETIATTYASVILFTEGQILNTGQDEMAYNATMIGGAIASARAAYGIFQVTKGFMAQRLSETHPLRVPLNTSYSAVFINPEIELRPIPFGNHIP